MGPMATLSAGRVLASRLAGALGCVAALSVVGCEAEIAGDQKPGGADHDGPPSAAGSAGTGGGATTLPGELNAPYTRLTRAEYKATVKAAFNVEAPVNGIPDDERIGPFTSNVVAPDAAHELLLASEDLAALIVPTSLPACSGAGIASCIATSYRAPLERLYRRPLSDTELARLSELVQTLEGAGVSAEAATRGMLVTAFMSADFLFRASPLSGDVARGRRLAEHLSYALLDAPPDAALAAASQGDVSTLDARLKEQALRLSGDERAVPVLARFLAQWLFVDVDRKLDDASTEFATSPVYAELLGFVKSALVTNAPIKSFVNGSKGYVKKGNFAAYGLPEATGATDVLEVAWSGARRGILGEELFLDTTRHPQASRRPIYRGHLVRTSLLCQPITSPPAGVVDLDADIMDRTVDARCAGCHSLMDPIGKAFAPMDLDNSAGSPAPVVNGAGEISGTFADLPTLLDAIANSQTYADCFSRNLLGFFLEQDPERVDAAAVSDVSAVVKAGGGLGDALAQVVVSFDKRSRTVVPWCTGE